MASNRTTQADLLRTVYQPRMRMQFNLDRILLQVLERNEENYAEGKEISLSLHSGQTGGFGWSNTGVLPVAGQQEVDRAVFNYHRMYGRIEIDGPHVEGASRNYAAEARPYDLETRNLVRQMAGAFNFDLFGDGSGFLTSFPLGQTIDSSGGTSTMIVDSIKGLTKNMRVDLRKISDGTLTDGFLFGLITSISTSAAGVHTVVVTVAEWTEENFNTTETNYGFYRGHVAATGSYNAVVSGLDLACGATGTYGGINRSTAANSFWRGQTFDAGTLQAPFLALIERGVDLVDINSDGKTNLIITTHAIWAHLVNNLIDQKRWTGDAEKLNGWARTIDFNGIPIVRDKHCPDGVMWLLDTTTLKLFQNNEGEWMNRDGAILHRVVDKHAYEAAWWRFVELVCDQPAANCKITDLIVAYPTS